MNPDNKKDIPHHTPPGLPFGAGNHNPLSLSGTHGESKEKNLLAPSSHQEVFLFTHRKAEKLSAAVYLITSFLSDNEPMKWKMRALALSVLESISALRGGSLFEREHSIGSALRSIADALSLIEIAAMSGMLSEMNYRVLKAEYTALRNDINKKDHTHSPEHFEIPRNFFDDHHSPEKGDTVHSHALTLEIQKEKDRTVEREVPVHPVQGQHKGQENVRYEMSLSEEHEKRKSSLPARTPAPMRTDLKSAKKPALNQPHKSARRDIVLNLFKKGAKLSVKNVAQALHGVSEKTAQRELASLVDTNVLKRTGERRWSIYSLS